MRWLITAANEFEGDMICDRLAAEGIETSTRGAGLKPAGLTGSRDIYVADEDHARALAIVAGSEAGRS